ncbi:MAG: hypothetical protein QMO91_04035 [Candidatus Tisiphia sp.]|nr:hypothetical protein [Candidatus Tisiphia sp.]
MPLLSLFSTKSKDLDVSANLIKSRLESFKGYDNIKEIDQELSKDRFKALNEEGAKLTSKISQFDKDLAKEIKELAKKSSKLANAESQKKLTDMQNLQLKSNDWSFQLNKSLAIIATRAGEKPDTYLLNMRINNSHSTDEFILGIEQILSQLPPKPKDTSENKGATENNINILYRGLLENVKEKVTAFTSKNEYDNALKEIEYLTNYSSCTTILEIYINTCIKKGESLNNLTEKAKLYKDALNKYEKKLKSALPEEKKGVYKAFTKLSEKFEEAADKFTKINDSKNAAEAIKNATIASELAAKYDTPTEKSAVPVAAAVPTTVPASKDIQKALEEKQRTEEEYRKKEEELRKKGEKLNVATVKVETAEEKEAAKLAYQDRLAEIEAKEKAKLALTKKHADQVVSPSAPFSEQSNDQFNGQPPPYSQSIELLSKSKYLKLADKNAKISPDSSNLTSKDTTVVTTDANIQPDSPLPQVSEETKRILDRMHTALKKNITPESKALEIKALCTMVIQIKDDLSNVLDIIVDPVLLFHLASSLLSSDPSVAKEACSKAIALNETLNSKLYELTDNREALHLLANTYKEKEQYADAIESYKKLSSIIGNKFCKETCEALKELGNFLTKDHPDLAIEAFNIGEKHTYILDSLGRAHFCLSKARVYFSLNNMDGVSQEAEKSLKNDGAVYKQVSDLEGLQCLSMASEIRNKFSRYKYLSKKYKLKHDEETIAQLKKYGMNETTNPEPQTTTLSLIKIYPFHREILPKIIKKLYALKMLQGNIWGQYYDTETAIPPNDYAALEKNHDKMIEEFDLPLLGDM